MSETRTEWRVVCANGTDQGDVNEKSLALLLRSNLDEYDNGCGPHRVQSRTVSTSEWADTDVNALTEGT